MGLSMEQSPVGIGVLVTWVRVGRPGDGGSCSVLASDNL